MKHLGVCKLCKESHELKNSHIIPSSIIKLIRDKSLDNRFYELFGGRSEIKQDGPKEYLLCHKCEQRFSDYEKYFKEAIHSNRHRTKKAHDGKRLIIENLDYKRMKLFFLSLLWRASLSSRPEFENICIGDDEEIIRKMILCDDPGKSSRFAVMALVPLIDNQNSESWCTNFNKLEYGGCPTLYTILLGGIFYLISSAKDNVSSSEDLFLNESGRWSMRMLDVSQFKTLRETIRNHFND